MAEKTRRQCFYRASWFSESIFLTFVKDDGKEKEREHRRTHLHKHVHYMLNVASTTAPPKKTVVRATKKDITTD